MKLSQALWLLILTGAVLFFQRQLMDGAVFVPALGFVFLIGMFVLLQLKEKFWYLIPISLITGVDAIPIGPKSITLSELLIPACFGWYILRSILLQQRSRALFCPANTGVLLYFGWVLMVFCLNPSGLLIFGSSSIGARFYFKILLAFLSFFVLSNVRVEEKDCRRLVWILLIGMSFNAVNLIFGYNPEMALAGDFYSWHQQLAGPALVGVVLLFARFKFDGVLGGMSIKTFGFVLCLLLLFFSGKRAALACAFLVPPLQIVIDRQNYRKAIIYGLFGIIVFAGLVAASHAGALPKTVQRSLANVPGMKLDSAVERQTRGTFRADLREAAWNEVIKKRPVFGLKGYSLDYEELASFFLLHGGGGTSAGHALSRNWHTTWLGVAADFGVPCAFFWAIFCFQVLYFSNRYYRQAENNSYTKTLLLYFFMMMSLDLLRSFTSGHSAKLPLAWWGQFGLILSIGRGLATSALSPAKTHKEVIS